MRETAGNSGVDRIFDAYQRAIYAKDVSAFMALYSQDVRVFDAWECYCYEDADTWRAVIERWFNSLGKETVQVSIQEVRTVVSSDYASASALVSYTAIAPDGGQLRSMKNRLSWVLACTHTGWKIVHEHTSVPINKS